MLEVIGQLHHAAHEHGVGFVGFLNVAIEQSERDALHFLNHQRSAVELDHTQGALYLVQIGCAEAHLRSINRVVYKCLKRLSRLLKKKRFVTA